MFLSDGWQDYERLDSGTGEKLERGGDITLLRPEPQAIWPMNITTAYADAHYIRSSSGGGHWEYARELPEGWKINYSDLTFVVRPTGFKHTGIFPEQAVNWDWMRSIVSKAQKPFRALNLFAYTGGATCALASAGAEVVHVDAARGIVAWAKANVLESGLSDRPVRFIVDDVLKFVKREQRRGNTYHGILMDPPSYGRGPNGEMWKIEDCLYTLVTECVKILDEDAHFFLLNSYTTGLSSSAISNVLRLALAKRNGRFESGELGLPVTRGPLVLPCGSCGRWYA